MIGKLIDNLGLAGVAGVLALICGAPGWAGCVTSILAFLILANGTHD